MHFSKLFAYTQKEAPKDAVAPSHILLLKGGYIKQVAAGIYNFLPLGKAVLENIKSIVQEELNKAGCNEITAGLVTPCELWQESGRFEKYGKELLRLSDRKEQCFVLSPTNEETFVDTVRGTVKSYKQLPINLYQINTKFRDEFRPRFGLLRGREFVMKDGYSFHKDKEDLDNEFLLMEKTYFSIFERLGLDFRAVFADSGAIGGSGSKEFMVLADTGEDTLAVCTECEYAANLEVATKQNLKRENDVVTEEIEQIHTPGSKSIEDVCEIVGVDPHFTIKAVIKKAHFEEGDEIVVFFVRGTDSLEETKAKNAIFAKALSDASEEEIVEAGLVPGFTGPFGIPSSIKYLIDEDLRGENELVAGANLKDYHIKGASLYEANVLGNVTRYGDISAVKEGDNCPKCREKMILKKGIEVGHIFKLGNIYSKAMNATFLDEQGKSKAFEMGCYGIGVSRLVAAAIEQNHDDNGILWPKEIAPYHVDIIVSNMKEQEQVEPAFELYKGLSEAGFKVLLDDRSERFGPKIKDFELLGFPYALIVGKKIKEGVVEFRDRRSGEKVDVNLSDVFSFMEDKR